MLTSGLWGLIVLGLISCTSPGASQPDPDIVFNRAGYTTDEPKIAYLRNHSADTFQVIGEEDGQTYYTGSVSGLSDFNPISGDRTAAMDFSEVTEPGEYYLFIPDLGVSGAPFTIDNDVYEEELKHGLRSFYFQRCGTPIVDELWERETCHLEDGKYLHEPSEQRDVTGGWHDAGDYNKFVVTTAVSAGLLMQLYEMAPDYFNQLTLDIPESGNGAPDLLDEVRWALDWLLKMQRDDGAVYFKLSEKAWTGEYLPHRDPDPRYIFEVSSTATAGTAAVFAQAARLIREYDEPYANELLASAQRAWQWLEQHPDIVPAGGFRNPEGVHGGEYHDGNDEDERLWAAAELYKSTGAETYRRYIQQNYAEVGGGAFGNAALSWRYTGSLAMATIVSTDDDGALSEIRANITRQSRINGQRLVERVQRSPYRYILNEDQFYWGSNSVAMGHAFDLINIWRLTGEERYKNVARDQLHYILGRNPLGQAYVTSDREGWTQRPYHQWVITSDFYQPLEGMLVGGPNNQSEMQSSPWYSYPSRWYRDDYKEYTVNETAINYTAPYVYVLGFFTLSQETQHLTQLQ